MSGTPTTSIGRLALRVPAMRADAARQLALLVAKALDEAAGGTAAMAPARGARVSLQARADEAPDELATRVVERILDAVARGT